MYAQSRSRARDGDIRKYFSPHRSPTFACADIDCAHLHSPFSKRKQPRYPSPVKAYDTAEHKYAT
jgi:hypothetical protein